MSHCPLPCDRNAAIPLDYAVSKFCAEAPIQCPLDTLRSSSCGGHPTITLPFHGIDPGTDAGLPVDRVPTEIRRSMDLPAPDDIP